MTVSTDEGSVIAALETNASWASGSVGYLVSTSWWSTWVAYSSYSGSGVAAASMLLPLPGGGAPRPGPISNAELLCPSTSASQPAPLPGADAVGPQRPEEVALRPNLLEQQDFVVVSEASWQRLTSWYNGGPAIARRMSSDPGPVAVAGASGTAAAAPAAASAGAEPRWTRLVLYPLQLEVLYKGKDGDKSARVVIDPEATLAVLKAKACVELGVAEDEVVLWDYSGGASVGSLEEGAAARGEAGEEADAEADAEASNNTNNDGAALASASASAAAVAAAVTPMAVEGPEASGATAAAANVATAAVGGPDGVSSMDVDGGASASAAVASAAVVGADGAAGGGATAGGGYLGRRLRAVPLLPDQMLLLRRKDAPDSDSDEDACGSDNDTGAPATGKRATKAAAAAAAAGGGSGDQAGPSAAHAAAQAAMRRAGTAGASGSGSGGGGAAAGQRTSGGGSGGGGGGGGLLTYSAKQWGGRSSGGGSLDDSVMLRDGQLPGLAGLSNLGNTCFMNSSLQCLSHAVPLMSAFLGGQYLQDLNRTNPLGMKGELAEAFGALMQQLWRGGVSAVTPRSFKTKIGRFAPQFSGYAQHDSQEFLAFLLDGLHEDTNRIRVKPYVEPTDVPGRPDDEVAAEAWANYRARNNSLVVDHFQGLFKSKVDCPKCSFNSVKFDPFMYLSLPLPESRRRVVEVVLVRLDGGELPTRMALDLPSGATLGDLLRETAKAAELPAEAQASPESHLLAARPLRGSATGNHDELVVLGDARMRVADAMDAAPSGTSSYGLRSSSGSSDQGLVVYYYADAASGPRAEGLSPVVVHFKRPESPGRRVNTWSRGVWCGAPLVLYMPTDRPPYDPDQVVKLSPGHGTMGSSRPEWEIDGGCPLAAALAEVLRPVQRGPLPPPLGPGTVAADGAGEAGAGGEGRGAGEAGEGGQEVAGPPAGSMEEDGPTEAAASGEEMRPGTPSKDQDGDAAAAISAAPSRRRSSSGDASGGGDGGGDLMEGMEPLVVVAAAPGTDADGDAAMPGTLPPAVVSCMEDGDVAAAPSALPAVMILGPLIDGDEDVGVGPAVQPFNMWSAQQDADAAAAGGSGSGGGGAPSGGPAPPGPAFALKLCNSKGDPALWGGSYDKDIDREHNREFLLMFSDACVREGGPYDAEQLDAPAEHPSLREHRQRAAVGPQPVSLDACMTTFLQPERLAESDAWYCPKCKEHVCADKKLDLWSLPEVLVVHLKRFCYTRYSRNKLDTRVDFPLYGLDLGPYVMRPQGIIPLYDCFAVSNHYGSLGGGHYTAYAKLPGTGAGTGASGAAAAAAAAGDDEGAGAAAGVADGAGAELPAGHGDRWYCFDDSHVSQVEPEAVHSSAAYVLFYRRRSEAAADPPALRDMLERMGAQRAEARATQAAMADGGAGCDGGGSPGGSGSDRQPGQDQDADAGGRGFGAGGGGGGGSGDERVGPTLGPVSLAAAAQAAQVARQGAASGDEELEVTGRSTGTFTSGRLGGAVSANAAGVNIGGGGGRDSPDLYGDGDAVAAPSSPVPMSVGRAGGGYDADDYDAFAVGGGGAGGGGGGEIDGVGSGPTDMVATAGPSGLGPRPLGSPVEAGAEADGPDLHNVDVCDLYQEVDAMDVARARQSGSDMASAGGNDQDDDVDGLLP